MPVALKKVIIKQGQGIRDLEPNMVAIHTVLGAQVQRQQLHIESHIHPEQGRGGQDNIIVVLDKLILPEGLEIRHVGP
jgi:hypothetical protein